MREILRAMLGQALARCAREGIPLPDFYQALRAEQEGHPEVSVAELFERAFRRLAGRAN